MQKANKYFKRIAAKFYQERLKIKKFYELKTEVLLNKGQMTRIKSLARGEEDEFSRNNIINQEKHFLSISLRQILQTLTPYQQEAFISQQELLKLRDHISQKQYLSEYAREGKI